MIIKIPRKCNSRKATLFPLPRMKKQRVCGNVGEIMEGNRFGRKTNLIYRAFSRQKCIRNWHILKI